MRSTGARWSEAESSAHCGCAGRQGAACSRVMQKGRDTMNRFDRERFDAMGKEALARVEEIMNTTKLNELIHKREEDEKKKNCILWILAIIGAVAAVAAIAYAVYRFFTPDYLEDFEDDFDDDFDDDFFDDEEPEKKEEPKDEKKEEKAEEKAE